MRSTFKFALFILLVLPVGAYGQFRPAKCEVQPLWVGMGVRSASLPLMGTFEKEGKEGEDVRSFKHKDSPLIATVGIDYQADYSKKEHRPYEVRLAITVSDKEQKDIFESVESSEARTRYVKKWNLSVTRNVYFDNRVYMFSLRCWDAVGFAGKVPLLP